MDAFNKWIFFISINILLISILRITLPTSIIMLVMATINTIMGLTFSVIGTQKNPEKKEINWHAGLPFFSGFICLAFYLA